jgi:SAM-dependent methyltransferase
MTPAQAFHDRERSRWNGMDGESWARQHDRMDRTLAPVLAPLLVFAAPSLGSKVLDVGCGCGATTVELARLVGPSGHVTGIDVSEPMLSRAKERLRGYANATCLLGDAAELPLQHLNAGLMVSRFGIMFFGDAAAAFANLRTALAPGGCIRFACWRPIHENPWLQIPLHAVYEHAPRLPKPAPDEPGPFSFADPERVTRILTAAGFSKPSCTRLDVKLDLAAGGSFEEAVTHATETGPAKRALTGQPENIRGAAKESIRKALQPYASPQGVKLAGAVWLVSATAP